MMMTEENNWVVHQSFRTTEAEDELIRQKMKVFGIRKKSLLFRAMVLNGYLLKLDLPEIRELIRLMKNLTNNVNQMAKEESARTGLDLRDGDRRCQAKA